MNRLLPAVLSVVLVGCTTPPGQLQPSDFKSATVHLSVEPAAALGAFYEGLRRCGARSSGIFVTHYGVPDCAPPEPDGSRSCDLYIAGTFGGRSSTVLGRADFEPASPGTTAAFHVVSYASGKEKTLSAWRLFTAGRAEEVCPKSANR